MRPVLDPAGHRVPRTKPTCLLHTWRTHRRRPFALVLHLHQHQSSRNLHLQYLAKNQSTQRCQSLITQGSDHPLVLEPHMVLTGPLLCSVCVEGKKMVVLPITPHPCFFHTKALPLSLQGSLARSPLSFFLSTAAPSLSFLLHQKPLNYIVLCE
jgi:hypothetical protein